MLESSRQGMQQCSIQQKNLRANHVLRLYYREHNNIGLAVIPDLDGKQGCQSPGSA